MSRSERDQFRISERSSNIVEQLACFGFEPNPTFQELTVRMTEGRCPAVNQIDPNKPAGFIELTVEINSAPRELIPLGYR